MKEIISYLKRYGWVILIIFGLPILLNFLVFMPKSKLSVGSQHDWMSFWGSYLGATISALVAFVILYIQRKDNKIENSKNKQLQLNVLSYQQEVQWLSELRKAIANHICAYRDSDIKEIVNNSYESSYDSIQQKIKAIYETLALTDTALGLVIMENPQTMIGETFKTEQGKMYTRFASIIKDIQLLTCLYYNKIPISNEDSNRLNNLVVMMDINSATIDDNLFSEIAHQIIKPLPDIFEKIRELSKNCIMDERQRIDSLLNDSNDSNNEKTLNLRKA